MAIGTNPSLRTPIYFVSSGLIVATGYSNNTTNCPVFNSDLDGAPGCYATAMRLKSQGNAFLAVIQQVEDR